MKKLVIAILFSAFVLVSPSANAYLVMDNPSAITTQQDVMPFSVYPNPLTSKKLVVNVDFEETTVPVTFTISNVLGQAVFTYKLSSDDYKNGSFVADLSELSLDRGIYLMKMSRGDKTSVQKLVIK